MSLEYFIAGKILYNRGLFVMFFITKKIMKILEISIYPVSNFLESSMILESGEKIYKYYITPKNHKSIMVMFYIFFINFQRLIFII